ncbi:MAG TPA: hypothetical protein VIK32_05025, partial [Candidatus Limnocylindrales bacterium]
MIPRRYRNWVLFWTPVTWIVLELLMYPKDVPLSEGLSAVLKGFFSARIGAYPAWVLVLGAVLTAGLGILGLARKSKARAFNLVLIGMGIVFALWAFLAGGSASGWSAGQNVISYGWVLQTIVVVLGGVTAYFWAVGSPERAELLTWNTHQVWRLYRGNWQGMVGLGILVFFLLMALLAPFLIDHALLDPNAQIRDASGQLL